MISDRAVLVFGFALLAVAVASQFLSIMATGPSGWDDGAITASYALTLANSGEFALTQLSPRAEGSSSLLLVGILTLIYLPLQPDLHTAVTVTQLVAFTALMGAAVLLYQTARKAGWPAATAVAFIALFILLPQHMRELQNGMEMTLLGVLLLAFVGAFEAQRRLVFLLIPLILLVRFETIFYLGVGLGMVWLLNAEKRRFAFQLGIFTLVIFAVISAMRLIYFDAFFPNTVSAKMLAPYSASLGGLDGIQDRLTGPATFIDLFLGCIMVAAIVVTAAGHRALWHHLAFWLLIGFLAFTFLADPNSGYGGRMLTGALPVFFFLLIAITAARERFNHIGTALVFAALLAVGWQSIGNVQTAIKIALHGAWESAYVPAALVNKIGPSIVEEQIANPLDLAKRGEAAEALMRMAGVDRATVVVPDVGGIGLCCNETLRVIDNALLTDPVLATQGWDSFGGYLAREQPSVIFTHAMWSDASRIYDTPYFQGNYTPIFFEDMLFWISQDFRESLPSDTLSTRPLGMLQQDDVINDMRDNDWAYLRANHTDVLTVRP